MPLAETHPSSPDEIADGGSDFRRLLPRPVVRGKFLFAGEEKLYVRGVTYGPFRPDADGLNFPNPIMVRKDFAQMCRHGINAVRTYTVPPEWLLDAAAEHGLRVLVGIPWEQHITFLDERRRVRDLQGRIGASIRQCAEHCSVLGYAIGNEIPSPIARWYGSRRLERFLEGLYWTAKAADPNGLVTYVNYPSTEYLELPFLDFLAFNVYLESMASFERYIARLQNLAEDRPLMIGEAGLDSLRHGEAAQAQTLSWQIERTFSAGCSGLFLFAWTDEWYRGGHEIEDWKFGLTNRSRAPKPALEAVTAAFRQVPFPTDGNWPTVSVVVCTYNGRRTLSGALEALQRLAYPALEIIVVDDGSTDGSAAIARQFAVNLISIPNGGLSNARNVGWRAARGEIVAYLDDDAAPDPHWLFYLVSGFRSEDFAGVGGPNLCFPGDGLIARCVDHAPGNPTAVLLTDLNAEHLPGCNMAFRRKCLEAVNGFDAQFRIAGDDVDLCWRLQQRGWQLGYHPGAMVWHHRRATLQGYWKQQLNYGKAEAMLERKWPEKYNAAGHATWNGRLYSKGLFSFLNWSRRRIYHGTWGSAPFQSIYNLAPSRLASVLMLPEWYLVIAVLSVVCLCGLWYPPFRYGLPFLLGAFLPPLAYAVVSGSRVFYRVPPHQFFLRLKLALVTGALHFVQPAARLCGRMCYGLTPWRRRGSTKLVLPRPQRISVWSESRWEGGEARLAGLEQSLRRLGAAVRRGGEFDRWDLEVRGGLLGTARLILVIEEHGEGKQMLRFRLWPTMISATVVLSILFAMLASVAALDLNWTGWALLNIPALLLMGRTLYECSGAMALLQHALKEYAHTEPAGQRSSSVPLTQARPRESFEILTP